MKFFGPGVAKPCLDNRHFSSSEVLPTEANKANQFLFLNIFLVKTMAQWLRHWSTKYEILGSNPGVVFYFLFFFLIFLPFFFSHLPVFLSIFFTPYFPFFFSPKI